MAGHTCKQRELNRKTSQTNWFIVGANLKKVVRSFIARLIRLGIYLIRKQQARYILLTPSTLTNQIIFDRTRRKYISISIRDNIDLCTLTQVYLCHDYGTEKLKRHNEIVSFYNDVIDSSATPLIIDCGGNIGLASKFFADEYDAAKIICIEPDAQNIHQANINNNSPNIEFIEAAIGARDGKGQIIDPGLGNNSYRIESTEQGKTKIISINQLLNQYPQPKYVPFILKIDIEGFESDLFAHDTDWIEKFPLIIIELHDWMLPRTANSRNFLRSISACDRDFIYHGENIFSISNTLLKSPLRDTV